MIASRYAIISVFKGDEKPAEVSMVQITPAHFVPVHLWGMSISNHKGWAFEKNHLIDVLKLNSPVGRDGPI